MWQNFQFFGFLRDYDVILKFFHKYEFSLKHNKFFLFYVIFHKFPPQAIKKPQEVPHVSV